MSSSASHDPNPPLPPLHSTTQAGGEEGLRGSQSYSGDSDSGGGGKRKRKVRGLRRPGSGSTGTDPGGEGGAAQESSSDYSFPPTPHPTPAKGTKRAKRDEEGAAAGESDEGSAPSFEEALWALEEATREQEEGLARSNDETIRSLLRQTAMRELRDLSTLLNPSNPSRALHGLQQAFELGDARLPVLNELNELGDVVAAVRDAANSTLQGTRGGGNADGGDDGDDGDLDDEGDNDDYDEPEDGGGNDQDQEADEEAGEEAALPLAEGNDNNPSTPNNGNNNANNDTLTIPSDAPTDPAEASPPPRLRVGGGEVQASDVQITLVAWENMAQIDPDSPVITTKSDSQAHYLQSLSPSKKLKGARSDFVFVEKGHKVHFAMGKTEGTMKDLFKLYGEVTGLNVKDLSFAHASELPLDYTLEQCCLMKDDIVFVSTRKDERLELEEAAFVEKSDVAYMQQLQSLMLHPGADVVFDCTGKSRDGMQFFPTLVKGHCAVISSRCTWLGEKIRDAKAVDRLQGGGGKKEGERGEGGARKSTSTTTTTTTTSAASTTTTVTFTAAADNVGASSDTDETDSLNEDSRGIEVPMVIVDDRTNSNLSPPPPPSRLTPRRSTRGGLVSNIVEAPGQQQAVGMEVETSPIVEVNPPAPPLPPRKMLKISIPNHNPEAFKILLEFLYTNRCRSLGEKAFVSTSVLQGEPQLTEEDLAQLLPGNPGPISVENDDGLPTALLQAENQNPKTIWHKQGVKLNKSVPPYPPGKWPNDGKPDVTMGDVLSTLRLAEEAKLPKLSRMCEVAATELLENHNIATVIAECGSYMEKGKELKILKKAAMSHLLCDKVNTKILLKSENFLKALADNTDFMVPTLLEGLDSTLPHTLKRAKTPYTVEQSIADQDLEDRRIRISERKKNLEDKRNTVLASYPQIVIDSDFFLNEWYADMNERVISDPEWEVDEGGKEVESVYRVGSGPWRKLGEF
jgi:hypothetical protein